MKTSFMSQHASWKGTTLVVPLASFPNRALAPEVSGPDQPFLALLLVLPYIKCKTYKTSSNSRLCGEVEIFFNSPIVTAFPPYP